MKLKVVSGGCLAAAAIAYALSGAAVAPVQAKQAKTVRCLGVNSCKGTSMCRTAFSNCRGLNTCKGKGWLPKKSKAACIAAGGKVG